MKLFKKTCPTRLPAQTVRENASPFSALTAFPLGTPENRVFNALREAVPVADAAIQKIVRLCGGFEPDCKSEAANKALSEFFEGVSVAGCGEGISGFVSAYLDSLLTYGNAVGEIVPAQDGKSIAALYNAPLESLEVRLNPKTLETDIFVQTPSGLKPCPRPELIMHSALNPPCGEARGRSLLHGLEFVSSVLVKIFGSIGQNFDRMGNLRYAVTYKPREDSLDKGLARERALQIANEWANAMNTSGGRVKDFVAVGDVDIKVIGADSKVLDSEVPVRQLLEQIVAKTGLPPFLLGLNWSTTERMSQQQADMLTTELESYRRIITPAILKAAGVHLRLCGIYEPPRIKWDIINLQDEVETAKARLLLAQAGSLIRE